MPCCQICGKVLVAVGSDRTNGSKSKKYWHNKMHYKCFKDRPSTEPSQEWKNKMWADVFDRVGEQMYNEKILEFAR
jgi:hypothetical protein